ncbi:hypothetical protein JW823_02525 [bacterium]|nr:hypothetical protein [candidate division CSSED10-310 bacterium]
MSGSLYGKYEKSIDAKGRLNIPKVFRDELFKQEGGDIFLVTMDKVLMVFTESTFDTIDRQIRDKSPLSRKAREFQRIWGSIVTPLTWDLEGRIKLTEWQKRYAGIDRDVVLIGAWNRLEIWSREKFELEFRADDQKFSDMADELNFLD